MLVILLLAGLGYYGVNALRDRQVANLIAPYEGVYAPNVSINNISISGLTPQEALEKLKGDLEGKINSWSMNLNYQGMCLPG